MKECDEVEDMVAALELYAAKHHDMAARAELTTCEGEAAQCVWTATRNVNDPFDDLPWESWGIHMVGTRERVRSRRSERRA